MTQPYWLPPIQLEGVFAGSTYHARVDAILKLNFEGPCAHCRSEDRKGHRIKAIIRSVLNKAKRPVSYYAEQTIVPEVLKRCRHNEFLCHECVRFLPFPAESKSS